MKSKINIKSIVIVATVGIISLFFINMSLAANTGKISVETANLRENADENAKILEQLSINEEVEVIEKTGDWYQVKTNGMTGYIRQDLITVNGEVANTNSNNETTDVTNTAIENQEDTKTEKNAELGKRVVVEDTKLKIVPVINATDIIEVKKDEEVNVIETVNGWACVETQNTKGWIRKEKLQIQQQKKQEEQTVETPQIEQEQTVSKTLYVNTAAVRLRKEANTSSEIITTLSINTAVEVTEELEGWSKVKVDGKEGYISSSLLSTTKQETSRSSTTVRTATSEQETETSQQTQTTTDTPSGKGTTVVETAQNYIGSSYVYGASGPNSFDCSGFTSYVFKQHGVNLNRTAAGQYSNGVAVSRDQLQPGDLVMFGKSGINHVGIYIGGGQIVHAANTSRGVTIDTINSGYYNNNYVGARRVI